LLNVIELYTQVEGYREKFPKCIGNKTEVTPVFNLTLVIELYTQVEGYREKCPKCIGNKTEVTSVFNLTLDRNRG